MKKMIALFSAAILLLCGCQADQPTEEMPEDTPWNNGLNAVMETDDGYYMNQCRAMCVRYFDKASGTEIYLCAKPECRHFGDDNCTATYNYMPTINTVMYNGDIYILAVEGAEIKKNDPAQESGNAAIALYRARSDGSALDRVGEVISRSNSGAMKVKYKGEPFIIHKGYAYIPYSLTIGTELAGAGIMKMNIKTGAREEIYSCSDSYSEPLPIHLRGAGSYVYFDLDYNGDKSGTYRYSLDDGSVSGVVMPEYGYVARCAAVSADRVYTLTTVFDEDCQKTYIAAFDSGTLEELGYVAELDIAENISMIDMTVCGDKFFVYLKNSVQIYGMNGEKLGEIEVPRNEEYEYPDYPPMLPRSVLSVYNNSRFKVCNDKLYAACIVPVEKRYISGPELYFVYSCPIADVIAGSGKWETAYTVKGIWSFTDDKDMKVVYSIEQ